MVISLFVNVSLPKLTDPFPYQENIEQDWRLLPNYINYYKTHTMATCYGGIGNTLESNSEPQDINADIQDEYQADINDLENIEPEHQARLRDLTCEIEQLQQTVKANNNDPMDAIGHLEGKLNQLALTLHPTPWESSEQIYKHFM